MKVGIMGALLGAIGLAVVFILLTDGRYFGKRLMYWIYDRFGPIIFQAHRESERWEKLVKSLSLKGEERILDVGTATGELPLTIAAISGFQGQAVGLDWSPRMIDAAQEEAERRGLDGRVRFQVADAREPLPFEDDAFDVVFCLGLLETLPRPEAILREFVRVLKPGGRLVLSLYQRGLPVAVLSLAWYREHLAALGHKELKVLPFRASHDVLIAC